PPSTTIVREWELKAIREEETTLSEKLRKALKEAGLSDDIIDAGLDFWVLLKNIEARKRVSANITYCGEGKDNGFYHIKLSRNSQKAFREQWATYVLSRHFDFVPRTQMSCPLRVGYHFLTSQHDVGQNEVKDVHYWMRTLATFHRRAEDILYEEDPGFILPNLFENLNLLVDKYAEKCGRLGLEWFDKELFSYALNYLAHSPLQKCIHHDVKKDNRVGKYLVDLENICIGHVGIDLSLVLLQENISRDEWDCFLKDYAHTYLGADNVSDHYPSLSTMEDYLAELHASTRWGAVYSATREVAGIAQRMQEMPQSSERNKMEEELDTLLGFLKSGAYHA
ncbi:hypothetical protein D6774_03700, partial [Candidatus Woesearchaeota archaeon]